MTEPVPVRVTLNDAVIRALIEDLPYDKEEGLRAYLEEKGVVIR